MLDFINEIFCSDVSFERSIAVQMVFTTRNWLQIRACKVLCINGVHYYQIQIYLGPFQCRLFSKKIQCRLQTSVTAIGAMLNARFFRNTDIRKNDEKGEADNWREQ